MLAAAVPTAGPRLLRLLLLASLLLPATVLAAGGWLSWHEQTEQARAAMNRLVDAAYENATKILETNHLLLRQMDRLLAGRSDAAILADETEVHQGLAQLREFLPQVKNLLVYGADGRLLATANQLPADHAISVADRPYFQAAQAQLGVVVSRTALGRVDGLPFFDVVLRRQAPGGHFAGAMAVAISPGYFTSYFKRLADDPVYGEGLRLVLRRNDHVTLVAYPPPPEGAEVGDYLPMSPGLRQAVAASPERGEVALPRDDLRPARLLVWRRLPTLPLTIYAAVSRRTIVRRWAEVMITHLYFGVPATLALVAISLLALRRSEAAAAAAAQLLAEARRREQAEITAREAQKMEALGKLSGGIAHDFNNLLAVIMGNAELALTRPPERARQLIQGVIAAAQRGEQLTRQFLTFARHGGSGTLSRLDLREAVPRVLELLRPALKRDVALQAWVADDIWPLELDAGELEIALLNLAINARDAMPQGGRVQVRARNVAASDLARFGPSGLAGDHVALTVADTGEGMPPEVQARAFEPFFTTKAVGVGTGLGLSQVYGFARQSGGAAVIDSRPGRGTAVTLLLPRAEDLPPPPEPAAAEAPKALPHPAARRVLLVEDNDEVATVTAALLRGEGCEVDVADRVVQAEALLEAGTTYDLILSDIVMPGASGIDFAHVVRRRWPQLPIVLVTGFSDQGAAAPPGVPVIGKPLRLADFRRLLGSAETAGDPARSHR
jgi:two-component system NtrC family sensor kinase